MERDYLILTNNPLVVRCLEKWYAIAYEDVGYRDILVKARDLVYLGHTLAYYANFYDISHVLLLGRVMSGEGGDIVIAEARRVLDEEYPAAASMELHLPDEKIRRVGQSVAAASLPKTR